MAAMTTDNPRWEEFADRMLDATGNCQHNKAQATAILKEMGVRADDITASLAWFEERGGYCDCEIRLNVVLA
jgi:hypothetical protein